MARRVASSLHTPATQVWPTAFLWPEGRIQASGTGRLRGTTLIANAFFMPRHLLSQATENGEMAASQAPA